MRKLLVLWFLLLATMFLARSNAQQTNEKGLSFYGCANLSNDTSYSGYAAACKIYEPETRRRFIVVWNTRSVSVVPIDEVKQ